MTCPCGGGDYDACCGRFHAGAPAPTAEALMRSRYSAFVRERWDHLAATQVAPFSPPVEPRTWVGLTVRAATENEVEFTARWLERDREVSLSERSRFERRDGRWLYVDGLTTLTHQKLSRNEPCPCGSGKKLKACHGSLG